MLRPLSILVLSGVLLGAAGCSSEFGPDEARYTSSVKIKPSARTLGIYGFTPNPVSVSPRTEVVWTNMDSEPHQIQSAGGFFGATQPIAPGKSFSFIFTTPGPYRYFCALPDHREEGVINVTR